MRLFSNATKFLADTNNNIKKVVEATSPNDVVDALNNVSLAEAMYILPMTKMYNVEFTKAVQLVTGEFSMAVLAEFDDEFLVYKYDEDRDKWLTDSRFGMYGRVDYDYLDVLSYACEYLITGCDAYVNGVKGMKDVLEYEHERAVLISEVVGFDRALEMFTRSVGFSRIQVVKAEKTERNTLGVVTLERESTGRRFCVGNDK